MKVTNENKTHLGGKIEFSDEDMTFPTPCILGL
jgi:hypothetical protein